jgi:hypothetical protein
LGVFKINLKVLVFSQFVGNSFDAKSWTDISEKGVTHLRDEDLISRIHKCRKDIEKSHIDSMVDKNL